jgi:heme oxygenase
MYLVHESLAQIEALLADPSAGPATSRSARVSLPALVADHRFLNGPNWQQRIAAYPATTVYCTHLRDIAVGDGVGLLAHHYARHIEDLHAAADLRLAVTVAYGLHGAGRRFLTPTDTDLWRYADNCHRLLQQLPLAPADSDTLIHDAGHVHGLYVDIINDLSRTWIDRPADG